MLDFARTAMGRRFFEADVPRLVVAAERLAVAVERLAHALEALADEPERDGRQPTGER